MSAIREMTAPGAATPDAAMPDEAAFARIAARLDKQLAPDALDVGAIPPFGDHSLNPWRILPDVLRQARAAAVLIGLVQRPGGMTIILTRRTARLRDHAGQIALPGGKIDPTDLSPIEAAKREAHEEIGLDPTLVEPLGFLGGYLTRTGFRIIPVVARIRLPFALHLNVDEVDDCFEVPLAMLTDVSNYRLVEREWQGLTRHVYAVDFGDRTVWGVTAGILRLLCDRLSGSPIEDPSVIA